MIPILLLTLGPTSQVPVSEPKPDAISVPASSGAIYEVPKADGRSAPDTTEPKPKEKPEAATAVPAPSSPTIAEDRLPKRQKSPSQEVSGPSQPDWTVSHPEGPAAWQTAQADSEVEDETASDVPRTGLLGLGLGVEVPLVGIFGGVATMSRVGAGFTFGGAVTYDLTPTVTLRLHATWGETRNASAPLSFRLSGVRQIQNQPAEWLTFDIGLGAAYRWLNLGSTFAPYWGFEAGLALMDGFEFTFDETLEDLVYDKDQRRLVDNGRLFGQDVAFIGGTRLGIRLDLDSWLASLVEVRVSYIHGGEDPVNNTLKGPDVRTVPEHIWLLRGTFSVWVGL